MRNGARPAPYDARMPTIYATDADLTAYAAEVGYTDRLPDAAARANLLAAAEHDVDDLIGLGARDPGTGLYYTAADVAAMGTDQADPLKRAVCAQVLYRIEMGPEHFVRAQRERVTGRAFSADGKLPIVGPQAERELLHSDLQQLTTTTGGGRRSH